MKMKYIIIKSAGTEVPVVFSQLLLHTDIAIGKEVCAAGFCELDDECGWHVYGESTSLNLDARPQDAQILNIHLPTVTGSRLNPEFCR